MIAPGDLFEIALIVPNLEQAIETFSKAFGYRFTLIIDGVLPTRESTGEETNPRMRLAVSQSVPQIELLEATPETHLVPPSGTGLHHLGYYVDDLQAASDALAAMGMPLIRGGVAAEVYPAGWVYHALPDGTLIELVDRQSSPMRTMIMVGQTPESPMVHSTTRVVDGWRAADAQGGE